MQNKAKAQYSTGTRSTALLTAHDEIDHFVALGRIERNVWDLLLTRRAWLPGEVLDIVANAEADVEPCAALRAADADRLLVPQAIHRVRKRAGAGATEADIALIRAIDRANAKATAKRQLIATANLRLVMTIARTFERRRMAMDDLIQEGNLGLLTAIGRFDPERGVRFATYAVWWIRNAIRRALADKARTVRVPVHVVAAGRRILKTSEALSYQLGREPAIEEIADAIGMDIDKVEHVRAALTRVEMSLDTPANDSDDRAPSEHHMDLAADAPTPREMLIERETRSHVSELLASLEPREASILHRRHGLDGSDPETLSAIGESFGVSRERVRQLQVSALARMRAKLASDAA